MRIVSALAGTVRIKLTPIPLYKPLHPSSLRILPHVTTIPSYIRGGVGTRVEGEERGEATDTIGIDLVFFWI